MSTVAIAPPTRINTSRVPSIGAQFRTTGRFAACPLRQLPHGAFHTGAVSLRIACFGALLAALAFAGCGSTASDGGATSLPATTAPGSTSVAAADGASGSPIDPSRFVFGALPGKPVVYWIHTDW